METGDDETQYTESVMFDIAAGYDGKGELYSLQGEASASPAAPLPRRLKAGEADKTCFAPTIKNGIGKLQIPYLI